MFEKRPEYPAFSLRLLGTPEIRVRENLLYSPVLDKPWALLVYLAVERACHKRSDLARLLWPHMPERSGRANLSVALCQIVDRTKLPLLRKDRNSVSWAFSQDLPEGDPVDVVQLFSNLPPAGCDRLHDPDQCRFCRENFVRLKKMARKDFLEGVELPLSPAFHAWVDRTRKKVSEQRARFELHRDPRKGGMTERGANPDFSTLREPRQAWILSVLVESSEAMDVEDLFAHLQPWSQRADSIVRSRGGWLVPFFHTGLLAYFGFPKAREESIRMAVHAAREIRDAFSSVRSTPGLALRIGIHTGEVTSDLFRNIPDVTGERTKETIVLASKAPPGKIVASHAAVLPVRPYFRTEEVNAGSMKTGPLFPGMHILEEETDPEVRDAVFVGREPEMGTLWELWKTGERGRRTMAWIVGEAGIGKSSLVHALVRRVVSSGRKATVRKLFCLPEHQGTAWAPLIRHLRTRLGLEDPISSEERLYRMERYLLSTGHQVSEALPILEHFLDGPGNRDLALFAPDRIRSRIESLLLDILIHRLQNRPLLLVLEDLHWADNATLDLLEKILGRLVSIPMMVVVTSRTEEVLNPLPLPAPERIVRLEPLKNPESRQLVERLSAGSFPDGELQKILDLGGGVPLFLKELVSARTSASGMSGAGLSADIGLPYTLRALLASRIDSLGEFKYLSQVAACLGQSFSFNLLESVMEKMGSGQAEKVEAGLSSLMELGILEKEKGAASLEFCFHHALIRKALFDSLDSPVRRAIYRTIAEIIESRFPEMGSRNPEFLADCMTQGGLTRQAIGMWMKAAMRTAALGAYRDSYGHLERSLNLSRAEGDRSLELETLIAMGPIALMSHGYGSSVVEEIYEQAMRLCGAPDLSFRSFPVLFGLWASVLTRKGPARALPLAEGLEKTAAMDGLGTDERLRAAYALGNSLFWLGEIERSERVLDSALLRSKEAGEPRRDPFGSPYAEDPEVNSLSFLSFIRSLRGDPDEGMRTIERAIERATEIRHPNSIGFALAFKIYLNIFLNDRENVKSAVRASLELVDKYGFTQWGALAGLAQAWVDRDEESFEKARESGRRIREVLSGVSPFFTMVEAEAIFGIGRPKEAMEAIGRGREESRLTGTTLFDPEFLRLEGEIALRTYPGNNEKAGALFREALRRSLSMGAVWFALKAALSLSRVVPEESGWVPSILERIIGGHDLPEVREGRRRSDSP